jgi:hypothetical protein
MTILNIKNSEMKTILNFLFFVLAAHLLFGQEKSSMYDSYIGKADSLYKLKDYKGSAENYSLAFMTLGWKGEPKDRYRAAKSWTLSNVPDSAFDCLDRIVDKLGYSRYDQITEEEDFNSLHSDPRWQPLLERVNRNILPEGWYRWGSELTSFEMLLDSGSGQEGMNTLTIRSTEEKVDGFGTLMQSFLPNDYLGKRIKLTGYMKSKDIKGWAGFWMRVDQASSKKSLAFDNMQDRPVKGTTDWKIYEIVLEVPPNASGIAFGALLKGTGQIWFERLEVEVAGRSDQLTGRKKTKPNLNFEK